MDEKEVLLRVLTIIDYKDNKIDFITKFLSVIYVQAMGEMLDDLDPMTEKKLEEIIKERPDETVLKNAVASHLSKEEFDIRLKNVTQTQFTDYLETIYPTLSTKKQEELTTYLSTLQPK